jgi:hypothetical protein
VDFTFIAVSAFALWFCARRPRARLSILFVILLADLLRLHWDHFYPFPSDFYRKPPETVKFLDQATSPFWRVSHYLEYPGLEMWQMHNDPMAHFNLLEREKLSLSFGIHAIFGYKHVGAHLPLLWNWDPSLSPAGKSTRYLFTNRDLSFFRGDSVKLLGKSDGVNAYQLPGWRPRIERLPASPSTDSPSATACPQGYSGHGGLCVYEPRDGHLTVLGAFHPGDTLIFRERAYSGWRYRIDHGSWRKAPESADHFLAMPLPTGAAAVEVAFFPRDFYLLSALAAALTALIGLFLMFVRLKKNKP